ncbi:hypothetical protein [Dysosmobacter sp.]
MQERVNGNEYRTTLVCVDDYRQGSFSGRLYNPYWKEGREFQNVMQFLREMEGLLDRMKLPQSFTAKRSFAPPPSGTVPTLADGGHPSGKKATFQLRVIFRQNASWQGSVLWMESRREESFRSVLELLLLMDGVLLEEGT